MRPTSCAAFDRLEVVEAEPMAGRRDEAVVGLVVRRRRGWCGTLFGRPVLGQIELELVEPLLVVEDRALGAEDLDRDAALAAPGGAADAR